MKTPKILKQWLDNADPSVKNWFMGLKGADREREFKIAEKNLTAIQKHITKE